MGPTPGGFPTADRVPNAIQIRITESAFTTLQADPAVVVSPLTCPPPVAAIQKFSVPAVARMPPVGPSASVGRSASVVVGGDRVPTIVYQDGLVSDVEIARYEQGSWHRSTLMGGARLDGFYVATAADGADFWMSHFFYEVTPISPGELEISSIPE